MTATSVRSAMADLIGVINGAHDDVTTVEQEIKDAMQALLALPGLDTAPAQSTSPPGSPFSTSLLYYDGEFRVVRGTLPAGFVQKPHNHGAWNILAVYKGAMHYRSYRRADDRQRPYYADLELAEDWIMTDGDVTVMPGPPHDIHATAGLAPTSITLLIAREQFLPMREQYMPEMKSYYVIDGETAAR